MLDNRSEGAVEYKHENISAVLIDLGYPYIEGYKPATNYQYLLFDVVTARLSTSAELEDLVAADVDAVPNPPTFDDILSSLVDPPTPRRPVDLVREAPRPVETMDTDRKRPRIDYLRRESSNSALGAAGERYVLEFERARLVGAGREQLAAKIEHVSQTRGDGDGFDILSFETSGKERLIEVKTTKYGAQTPFFVSTNEVDVSEREAQRYHLYRVFRFRKSPKLFDVRGSFRVNFSLSPTQYKATI